MSEIKVLWLDDESDKLLSNEDWRAQFEDEGIVLHAEKYAEQAIERIKENPAEWDLVLLDAIGYKKEGSGLNKAGLPYAILEVRKVEMTHNVQLPIFIYTGQDSLFEDDEFVDSYSDIPIYRKGWAGTEGLICDIKKLISSREDRIIKDMYPKVFEAIDLLQLKESEQKLLCFLKAIHFKEFRLQRNPIADLRIILEEIFQALTRPDIGLIPRECYKSDLAELNMAATIQYISGEQTNCEFGKSSAYGGFGVIDKEGPIYPSLMASFINTFYVFVSATESHVKRRIEEFEALDLKEKCMVYASKVSDSYIGFSFVYQLCDILTYTAAYVKSHPDGEGNGKRAFQLRNDVSTGCTFIESEGILTFGDYCWAEASEFSQGDSVNLRKVRLEAKSNGQYTFKICKK